MSIIDEIRKLVSEKHLTPFLLDGISSPKRRLYLTREATKALNDPNSPTNLLSGKGYIHGALVKWVCGEQIYKGFLKRLDEPPPEIWAIRVTEPVVQSRLFGRFAYEDTIILTHFHTRQALGPRLVRGQTSQKWAQAMSRCESSWNSLFPTTPPFFASTIADYVTENCDDFRI